MPSASSGNKKIKSIKVYKDHVTLSLSKGESLKISKEAYLSSYLYEGKALSNKEINKLKDITALSALLNYALSLISKRHYSQKKLFEKLMKKENNREVANKVIDKLKDNDLLDDHAYMEDLIEWDKERGFGKNKIIKHLKEQGIPEAMIAKAHFSPSKEVLRAKGLIPKLERKYSHYAYENKKKHIYQALLSQGYDYESTREALDLVKSDKPKVEKEKLIKDYKIVEKRYKDKYEGYKLYQKIMSALINKGYKSSEIRKVMEEYANENDF